MKMSCARTHTLADVRGICEEMSADHLLSPERLISEVLTGGIQHSSCKPGSEGTDCHPSPSLSLSLSLSHTHTYRDRNIGEVGTSQVLVKEI